jgi:hypothetical protein
MVRQLGFLTALGLLACSSTDPPAPATLLVTNATCPAPVRASSAHPFGDCEFHCPDPEGGHRSAGFGGIRDRVRAREGIEARRLSLAPSSGGMGHGPFLDGRNRALGGIAGDARSSCRPGTQARTIVG